MWKRPKSPAKTEQSNCWNVAMINYVKMPHAPLAWAVHTLTDRPEEEILTLVRRLAVREENTMVARVALHNMRQDRDETVQSFRARIRGRAGVCK